MKIRCNARARPYGLVAHLLIPCLMVFGLAGCSSQALLVKQPWHEIQSDHFRVITDGEPAEVEALVQDLERFRLVMTRLINLSLTQPDQLTILALKNTASYEALVGPKRAFKTAGIFYDQLYGRYALINLNGYRQLRFREGEGYWARRFLFHEYTHYLTTHGSSLVYPYWYQEGFAELLSTIEFELPDRWIFGKIPVDRALSLNGTPLIDVEKLLTATRKDTPQKTVSQIYASGWLLAHMWNAQKGYSKRMFDYFQAVHAGRDPLSAYEDIFQSSIAALQDQYEAYNKGDIANYSVVYPGSFGDINTRIHAIDRANAVAELSKFLALTGQSDALQQLRRYADRAGLDTGLLDYSIALAAIQQNADSVSPLAEVENGADVWPKLVYAEYLCWTVEQKPELRETNLTRAYHLYKNIVKADDSVAAAWFGLGRTASQLMVPASTYSNYYWKAFSLSPQNERAAVAYAYALYEAEEWPVFVDHGRRILPLISDPKNRRTLQLQLQALEQHLPETTEVL